MFGFSKYEAGLLSQSSRRREGDEEPGAVGDPQGMLSWQGGLSVSSLTPRRASHISAFARAVPSAWNVHPSPCPPDKQLCLQGSVACPLWEAGWCPALLTHSIHTLHCGGGGAGSSEWHVCMSSPPNWSFLEDLFFFSSLTLAHVGTL